MIVAGIDLGSRAAKAVVLDGDTILCSAIISAAPDSVATARLVMQQAMEGTGMAVGDVRYIVSTGYGRVNVPFANSNVTEISCHARGMHWLFPDVRTILDIGGQDCKAIRCDETGKVTTFVMNDKCAAGTGRYLERAAAALGLPLEEIGPLSLTTVQGPAPISSYCAVFAQTDIVTLLRDGRYPSDILAGVCEAVAKRVCALLNQVGIAESFSISGGVAKNIGIVRRLEDRLMLRTRIAAEPQIIGALGAALFAYSRAAKAVLAQQTGGIR